MRLLNVTVRNYRSLKEFDLALGNINAIVGPNNVGKSNFVNLLYTLLGKNWLNRDDFSLNDIYRKDDDLEIGIDLFFEDGPKYKKIKSADPVTIERLSYKYTKYKIGPAKGQRRLEQACLKHDGEAITVQASALKRGESLKFEPIVSIPMEVREQIPLIYISPRRNLDSQLPDGRYSMLRQLLEDIDKDFHDPDNLIAIAEGEPDEGLSRSDKFARLMSEMVQLLKTDNLAELESDIKENALKLLGLDPSLDSEQLDFYFAPFSTKMFYQSLQLMVKENGYEINALELGGGFQNALIMSIMQAFEQRRKSGAVFLIEEPEMYLHPQMQRALFKTLQNISSKNQVIYTTHSANFVSVPEFNSVVILRRTKEEGTKPNLSSLEPKEIDTNSLIKDLDPERNEMFFASKILFVEGDTEKMSLPVYAERLGLDIDKENASIIEVGGKRALLKFAKIAASFNIPVGIIHDEDGEKGTSDEDNKTLNGDIEGFCSENSKQCWKLDKNYEEEFEKLLNEDKWQEVCQKYPKKQYGKPGRARMIALDDNIDFPEKLKEALLWLCNKDGVGS